MATYQITAALDFKLVPLFNGDFSRKTIKHYLNTICKTIITS